MGIGYGILYRIISVLVIAAVSGLLTYATARAAPCTLTATDINGYLAGKSSPLAGRGGVRRQGPAAMRSSTVAGLEARNLLSRHAGQIRRARPLPSVDGPVNGDQ